MEITYNSILEIEGEYAIIEADETMKQSYDLKENERMVYLIEGSKPEEMIMSLTQWNDGTVTLFNSWEFEEYESYEEEEMEDWDTGYNELLDFMEVDQADRLISELEDYDS